MNHQPLLEPSRLVESRPPIGSPEEAARQLILSVAAPEPLSSARLARIRARISEKSSSRRPDWATVARAVVAVLLFFIGGTSLASAGGWAVRLSRSVLQLAASVIEKTSPEPSHAPVAKAPLPTQNAGEPAPLGPPVAQHIAPPFASPTDLRSARRHGSPATVAAKNGPLPTDRIEGPLALETRSLLEIGELLQAPDGASAALARLATYRARFPQGALTEEADLAELKADVALGRRAEALGVLGRLERSGGPRPAELRALHGELLAQQRDCSAALEHWNDAPSSPDLAERLLYDRASCLASLGRTEESRAAIEKYLTLYPTGRFAASFRAGLTPPPPKNP
jgi:hypothetical protein